MKQNYYKHLDKEGSDSESEKKDAGSVFGMA